MSAPGPAPPARETRAAAAGAALLGFFSVAAQTILARELLVLFHGSELALGVVLAAWLLLGGCGSLAAGRALAGRTPPPGAVAAAAAVAALSLPLAVLAVRFSGAWLPLSAGVVPGVRLGALASLAVLALPAAAGGAWFALAAAAWSDASGPGRAYAWEAAGGLAGGALFAFALAGAADALLLAGLLALVTALAAESVARPDAGRWRIVAAALAAPVVAAALVGPLAFVAGQSQAARWPGLELVAARDGRHGSLALARAGGQSTLFENGAPALSFPDPESAEAATHLPLLAAPAVGTVLLGEGALDGGLAEALKHPVARVDLVVPHRETLRFLRPHLPPEMAAALADRRVRVRAGDLRAWLGAHPATYDAVLLGRLDPASALANRLATRECFALVRAALRPEGVAALSLSAAPNYRGEELLARNASVLRALETSFPRVEALRDDPLTLLASAAPAALAAAPALVARLAERRLATRTLSPEVLEALLAPGRTAQALAELRGTAAPQNRDLAPAAYLHHARHREAAADPAAARWLAALSGRARWLPFALPALLAAAALAAPAAGAGVRPAALGAAAAATGATAMAVQFLVFFAYQTARGDLYAGLGALSGLFMAGLAAGAMLALRRHASGGALPGLLRAAAAALVALPLLAGGLLVAAIGAGTAGYPFAFGADLLAALAALAGGAAAGFAFPLLGLAHPAPGGAGGALYAWDLAGSAAGALLASLWLLPLLGFTATLGFLALLAGAAWALVLRAGPFVAGRN